MLTRRVTCTSSIGISSDRCSCVVACAGHPNAAPPVASRDTDQTAGASGGHVAERAGSPSSAGALGTAGSAVVSGSGGATAGTAAGSGGTNTASEDPQPHEPDLSGRVATSSRWVLLTERSGALAADQLILLDLDSAARHVTNPAGPVVAYTSWSPDGQALFVSDADADSDHSQALVRLGDSGYVPGAAIAGYSGVRGNFSAFSWSADSRFVLARRGGSLNDGIEIIDTATLLRASHADFANGDSVGGSFAPGGFYYTFYHSTPGSRATYSVARVTERRQHVARGLAG